MTARTNSFSGESRTVVLAFTTEIDENVLVELIGEEGAAVPSPDELRELNENGDLLVDLDSGMATAHIGGACRTIGRVVERCSLDYDGSRVSAVYECDESDD